MQTALLKDHLPAIVKNLPWPNDAPDPTVRNERLAELAKEVAVLSAQMEELHALAKEANMKLSR